MDAASAETAIRQALDASDRSQAATLTVQNYGPEVLGFIEDRVRPNGDAQDVFANVLEALWDSLERYRGECSMRTWCYVLARRAISQHRRGQHRKRKRELIAEIEQLSEITQVARSRTAPFQLTEVKNRARELRESLPDEDQHLLLLRLERGLSFRDIAQVMSEDDVLGEEQLTREAARLRKRFQLAKERLTELLVNAGLVQSE